MPIYMNEFDKPWIIKPGEEWTLPNREPDGLYLDKNVNASLSAMRQEATKMGIHNGVAYIALCPYFASFPRIAFVVVGRLVTGPNPRTENGKGINFFGNAMSKLAYSLSTLEDSGSNPCYIKNGEVADRGNLVLKTQEGSSIHVGFSGENPEQDVIIAQKGLSTLIELAEKERSSI